MSNDDADEPGPQAALRWIMQQLPRLLENLEEIDLTMIARVTGIDPMRLREYIDSATRWISTQAEEFPTDAAGRLERFIDPEMIARFGHLLDPDAVARFQSFVQSRGSGATPPAGGAPHPLDQPTPAQGAALSAIDSGRWTVEPGSHEFRSQDGSAPPTDASDLIGELRARDWINASGEVTQVGRHALTRWLEQAPPS